MLTEEKGFDLISYDGIRDEGGDAMSRVERHKNEYSKADRAAVENIRPSEDPADISFAYGKNGNNAAGETSGKTGGADVEVQRKGRAARRKAEAQNAEMGILDQTDEQKARSRKEARAMGDGKPELHINRFFGWLIWCVVWQSPT